MNDAAIKNGILQCRDLVQLYYGVRMVAAITEGFFNQSANVQASLIQQDPRRIRYELIMSNGDVTDQVFTIGTPSSFQAGNAQTYSVKPGATLIVERTFLSDFDAVTIGLDATVSSSSCNLNTRETFLTPLPADES